MTQAQFAPTDAQYKSVLRTMKRFKYRKDALLEVLNTAQESYGYLSKELLVDISEQLMVPITQVYGVATFYHMFSFDPLGEHNCIICTGTACHVKGSGRIVEALEDEFDIPSGQTTPDGRFSLRSARCVGSCGLAPVIVLDGQVLAKETPESTVRRVVETLSLDEEQGAINE